MCEVEDVSLSNRLCPMCDGRLLRYAYDEGADPDDLIPGGDIFVCDACEVAFLGTVVRHDDTWPKRDA